MTQPLVALLREIRAALANAGDHESAAQFEDLMVAVASADELHAAMERGDEEAVTFHAESLDRSLEQAAELELRTGDRPV